MTTINITDGELHKKLKLGAIEAGKSLKDFVDLILRKGLLLEEAIESGDLSSIQNSIKPMRETIAENDN